MVKLINVRRSTRPTKKLMATFLKDNGRERTIHFGQKGSNTFSEGATEGKKDAYLIRHKKNEDWNNPLSAGALSRWVLWDVRGIKNGVAAFKKRFNL